MDDENQRRQEEVRPYKHAIIRAFGINPDQVPVPTGIWIFNDKITIVTLDGRRREEHDNNFDRTHWTEKQREAVDAYLNYVPSWAEE